LDGELLFLGLFVYNKSEGHGLHIYRLRGLDGGPVDPKTANFIQSTKLNAELFGSREQKKKKRFFGNKNFFFFFLIESALFIEFYDKNTIIVGTDNSLEFYRICSQLTEVNGKNKKKGRKKIQGKFQEPANR
jgi:hypothetical protein